MGNIEHQKGEEGGLRTRTDLPDLARSVMVNMEAVRQALGAPRIAEVEATDSRISSVMCTPFLAAEEFAERTQNAQVILITAFAAGAMPARLTQIVQQRIAEGIPVIVMSDNPGDKAGILKVTYDAGGEIYKAGAFALEKVNVNDHKQVKWAICCALDEGKKGPEIIERMKELYSFKPGEQKPLAEWDVPGCKPPQSLPIEEVARNSGFVDDQGKYVPQAVSVRLPKDYFSE